MTSMIADRYMTITSLGEGGMADVYLAVDTILNREVAVKILRGDLREDSVAQLRFLREASAISKLHHPNIVEVYDVGEYDDKNYIVMEYVRGRTLKQLILQRGALQKEEAVSIMNQIVSAVNHAHENNIIHRDIKPQNILVKDDGTIKITDFGIALAHDAVSLTQSDSILGSAQYIAPETTKGETPTIQVDIYALGIVFYELLTGDVPFKGDNPVQIAMKHLHEEMPSVLDFNPTLPQSIENIVIKATAKNRLKRYANANEMLYDLDLCLLPEFANVEKINIDEEDGESGTVVFTKQKLHDTHQDAKEDTTQIVQKSKMQDYIKKGLLTVMVLALTFMITFGIYMSGIIEGFSPVNMVVVPDLSGLTLDEAEDKLAEVGLLLNEVDEEMTDDIEKGLIFVQSPKEDVELEEGSKVDVTISSGKYYFIENYVGKTLSEVRSELEKNNIKIFTDYEKTKDYPAGTIIEQKILNEGDRVNPNRESSIRFVIAQPLSFVLVNYVGMDINSAKQVLEEKGATVVLEKLSTEGMEQEELDTLVYDVVIKQSPEAQSEYTQEGDNVVTLYYY